MKATKSAAIVGTALTVAAFLLVVLITFIVSVSFQTGRQVGHALEQREAIERVHIAGVGTLDYERVLEAVSEPGEDMDTFVLRVAPILRNYTAETGFEACGQLAADGERFGVVVGSTQSHAGCGSFQEIVPEGMQPTGETIHSHRSGGVYRANENDHVLLGVRVGAQFKAGAPDEFSREDYVAPGYLVGARAVWHQTGRRTARRIGSL